MPYLRKVVVKRCLGSLTDLQGGEVDVSDVIVRIVRRPTGCLLLGEHLRHADLIFENFLTDSLNGVGDLRGVRCRTAGAVGAIAVLLLL